MLIETKAAGVPNVEGGVVAAAADDPFTFTIIGNVTGIVDDVGDEAKPGCFARTLSERRPKIIAAHDWARPLGKVLEIAELPPGDPRLPATTSQGKPWPAKAGALVAKVRLFKGTVEGREAAERWREYGADQQFSIGYVAKKSVRRKDDGVRVLEDVDLFEISDVLWGANALSGPMPSALATKVLAAIDAPATDEDAELVDPANLPADGPTTADEPVAEPVELTEAAPEGDVIEVPGVGDLTADGDDGFDGFSWEDVQAEAKDIQAEEKAAADAVVVQADAVQGLLAALRGDAPAAELEAKYDVGFALPGGVQEVKYDTSPVGEPGGRQNWVDKAGGLPKFIRAIAHALIRDGHTESGAISIAVATVRRWASGKGKVSEATRAKAAKALAEWEAKKTSSKKDGEPAAIEAADPEVTAEMDLLGWSPELDADTKAAAEGDVETKGALPRLPGTFEERQQALRAALEDALLPRRPEWKSNGERDGGHLMVEGTYDDHAIVTVVEWAHGEAKDTRTSWSVPYQWDGTDVTLAEPIEVELTVEARPVDTFTPDALAASMADSVDATTSGIKAAVSATEAKAGRVLSGPNADRIRSAVQALISVLKTAGIDLDAPTAPAAAPAAVTEGKTLDGLPDPRDLVQSLRATARG